VQYFDIFDNVFYKFGDEVDTVLFPNLSIYSAVVDEIKDGITFLNKFQIQEGFRPDQVSIQLYGTPMNYWTFYLINDDLREQGWPLPRHELENYIKKSFPNTTLNTRDDISTKFKIGQTVSGISSGVTGTIIKRNVDFGQIVIEGTVAFRESGELLSSVNSDGVTETITAFSKVTEQKSVSHYVDGNNNIVDVDPQTVPGAQITEKTFEDVYFDANENLRQIKVIKPDLINNVITSFKKSIKG
tara:strand:+ start:297 stop:1025 length:729 start_codon:yes stop_codon:yes gene_type:complete